MPRIDLSKLSNAELERIRLDMLTSFESYTRASFYQQYGRPFVMGGHHKKICAALQDVIDGKCTRLIINMPPRYGKTELAIKRFTTYSYALNPKCRFLHLSYSDTLVKDNSEEIREAMSSEFYTTLFPKSALKTLKSSKQKWETAEGGEFYAVSTQGQVTGFGAGNVDNPDADNTDDPITGISYIDEMLSLVNPRSNVFQGAIIIDDPLKPEDADSDITRKRVNQRFENTIRSRTNSRKTPIIIIMQRVHEDDLCGYLLNLEPDEWRVLSLPALIVDPETGEESALWELKHSVEELRSLRSKDPIVFDTQYMQDPKPREGLMYPNGFRTYTLDMLPKRPMPGSYLRKINFTDTADTGADFHTSICAVDTPDAVYVTDVLFTDEPMEATEQQQAEMLHRNGTAECLIESNNGGRGFSRVVKRILRVTFRNFFCTIDVMYRTQNKQTRIFTHSNSVVNDILFPEGWEKLWPKFAQALLSYRKDNHRKSVHDDAPDCVTGLWEMHANEGSNKGIKSKTTYDSRPTKDAGFWGNNGGW